MAPIPSHLISSIAKRLTLSGFATSGPHGFPIIAIFGILGGALLILGIIGCCFRARTRTGSYTGRMCTGSWKRRRRTVVNKPPQFASVFRYYEVEDSASVILEPPPAYQEYHFGGNHSGPSHLGYEEPEFEMLSAPPRSPLRSPLRSPSRSPLRSPLRSPSTPRYMGSDGMSTVGGGSDRRSGASDFW